MIKKILLIFGLIPLLVSLSAQDFFRGDFSRERKYVILVNPTEGNIRTIKNLLDQGVLDLDLEKIEFVGVYHADQGYDFNKSAGYLSANDLKWCHLHAVKSALSQEVIYQENLCSKEFRQIFESSVGIIFFGGPDIPPAVYNEKNLYSKTIDPLRHYFEISFLFHLLGGSRDSGCQPLLNANPRYVVTGFCLGMQSMNVAAGGTLYQDIPAQLYDSHTPQSSVLLERDNLHRNYWNEVIKDAGCVNINLHPIQFTEHGFFGRTVKVSVHLKPLVWSNHHQAVKDLAASFEATALSDDGKVIEAIAHRRYPNVFAVQFHPEIPALYDNLAKVKLAPDDQRSTIHSRLNKKSLDFHKKFWGHISEKIRTNAR